MDYSPPGQDPVIKAEPEGYGAGAESSGGPLAYASYFFSPLLDISGQFQGSAGSSPPHNDSEMDTGPSLFPFFTLSGVATDEMSVDPLLDSAPLGSPRQAHYSSQGPRRPGQNYQRRQQTNGYGPSHNQAMMDRNKARKPTPTPGFVPQQQPPDAYLNGSPPRPFGSQPVPVAAPLPAPTLGMMNHSPPPMAAGYAVAQQMMEHQQQSPPGLPHGFPPMQMVGVAPPIQAAPTITMDRGPLLSDDSSLEEVKDEEDDSVMSPVNADGTPGLIIETQPPIEVRTRTPSEKRNFSCSVLVAGNWKESGGKFVSVELAYAPQCRDDTDVPKQNILGGTKLVTIKGNGTAVFDNLSMSEASTKHKEKEFCLNFTLMDKNGSKMPFAVESNSFYAFSNTKVLSRRRDITLRTMSKNLGPTSGGEVMHVIGSPFIRGPSLKLILRTPQGDIPASGLELYSETVLFFTLPAYPYQSTAGQPEPQEVKCQVLVTNDGRNYSNPLDFVYVPPRKALRSYL